LVTDNQSSHHRKALVQECGERIGGLLWDQFTVHHTPKHGSWLNQAEIEIGLLSVQRPEKAPYANTHSLQREARVWNRKANRNRINFDWKITRTKARRMFR
jgi:DDE superfamily endonuclease